MGYWSDKARSLLAEGGENPGDNSGSSPARAGFSTATEGIGAPRGWAEAFATLDRARPVDGYSVAQWRQLIDDGGRFLDEWGAEAARLGWRAVDAFGVIRSLGTDMRPRDEVGQRSGLVPLISGGRVTGIGPDLARITMPTGTATTFYLRRPVPGAVAIWDVAASRGRAA